MPGISFIAGNDRLSVNKLKSCREILKLRDKYFCDFIHHGDKSAILFSAYEKYPVLGFDQENYIILMEGMIYNRSDMEIEKAVRSIADEFLQSRNYEDNIQEFMERSDGDFLVLIYFKKTKEFLIFNDRWGRLPVFYFDAPELFILSREMKFVLEWIPSIVFNREGIVEFLTLEYNLGDKTLIRDIRRLGPATAICGKREDSLIRTEISCLIPVKFRSGDHISVEYAVDQYYDLFIESLDNRTNALQQSGMSIITDLSGGYDTRAIFTGLHQAGDDFLACTDNLITGDESPIARELAETFGRELEYFSAYHPVDDFDEMQKVTYLTGGLINCLVDTACFHDDLEREKTLGNNYAHFMGMGGEFVRWVYRPKRFYPDLPSMILDDCFNHYMPVRHACDIAQLSRDDYRENLYNAIDGYEEADISDQARHLFFEYNSKTVNAGEDRHRIFSWTVVPMWGKDIFEYAVSGFPSKYIGYEFFLEFLERLDPRTLTVPFYGSGLRADSALSVSYFKTKMGFKKIASDNRIFFKLAGKLKNRAVGVRRLIPSDATVADKMVRLCGESRVCSSVLDLISIRKFLEKNRDRMQLYQLLTLVLFLRELEYRFFEKISND